MKASSVFFRRRFYKKAEEEIFAVLKKESVCEFYSFNPNSRKQNNNIVVVLFLCHDRVFSYQHYCI